MLCPKLTSIVVTLVGLSVSALGPWTSNAFGLTSSTVPSEGGLPFATHFSPRDYGGSTGNWAVVQDHRGVVFVGNNDGVLEYDGVSWQLHSLPGRVPVRSLALDEEGRLWVGAENDLGYFRPSSNGTAAFVSLKDRLPSQSFDLSTVWRVHAIGNRVYFQTPGCVLRYHPLPSDETGDFDIWTTENSFHLSFLVDGRLFVREWNVGLKELIEDRFQLVTEGGRFADERIYLMLPFLDGRILIGTRSQGLFLFDGAGFERFATAANELLRKHPLYLPGASLPNDLFALGTLTGGLIVIDSHGKLVLNLNHQSGLPDNAITFVYPDREGGLWLARENGLSRIELDSPYTRFDDAAGLEGRLLAIHRHGGRLYVGATQGVLVLEPEQSRFRPINGLNVQTWAFLSFDRYLLAASNSGVFSIEGEKARVIRRNVNQDFLAYGLHRSLQDPKVVIVALVDGLAALRLENGNWSDLGRLPVQGEAGTMVELEPGTLWVGTQHGAVRVNLAIDEGKLAPNQSKASLYGHDAGLPEEATRIFAIDEQLYACPRNGHLYRYDDRSDRFTEVPLVDSLGGNQAKGQCVLRSQDSYTPCYGWKRLSALRWLFRGRRVACKSRLCR